MKLSRASQNAIDALIRAVKSEALAELPATSHKANVKYFKTALEKHVAKLEKGLTASMAAQAYAAHATKRARRIARSVAEEEAHLVILRGEGR